MESVLATSGLSDDALLHGRPRIATRGIGRVFSRIFGKHLVMPREGLDRVGFLGYVVPQLLDEQEFLGRGELFKFGGESSIHDKRLGGSGGFGNRGGAGNGPEGINGVGGM